MPESKTTLGSLEDTVKKLAERINGNEETYKALMEFAHKLLIIAGVKII